MASLLDKIQTLVSADLNRLVDRALQANEPALFRHHLRDIYTMQEELTGQLASVDADLRQMRQRNEEQQSLVVKQDAEVDELLRMSQHDEALAAQERLNQNRLAAARMTERLEALERQYADLVEAKGRLDARAQALKQHEPDVEGLVGLAHAKELTAAAMNSLEDLAGSGDPDIARVVNSIRQRLAEAESQIQQLEQRALVQGETPEVLKRKELESQLEARKARLGLG